MDSIVTTGRTVEEAKEAALDQLGVDEHDAEFEVLEEARFGLFGRLRSEARVRAWVRPTKPRPKDDRRDRRGRRRSGSDEQPARDDAAATVPAASGPSSSASSSRQTKSQAAAPTSEPERTVSTAAPEREARSGNRRRRSSSRPGTSETSGRRPTAGPSTATTADDGDHGSDNDTNPGGGMDVALDEQAAVAKEFLDGLTQRMSLDATVAISQPEDDTVELNVGGQDLGLLIGPRGATLLAIQDLTRTVVQRKTSAANGRLVVDVSGYRRQRREALARFSRQVADEVLASGNRRVLEPMSAADRKIVHDTVNQIDGVSTVSEGEDPHRRVVILPAPDGN